MHSVRVVASLVLLILSTATAADVGKEPIDVDYQWGVKIPMRDGVELNATVYRPKDWEGQKLSSIITITPYISDRYQPDAQYFARHGFAFLVVDTRGRGNSDGEFTPMRPQDGLDGHDIVEWVAAQPWSDGQVALRGGSYGGYNQWATMRYFPEHLTTTVPIASAFPGVDFPMNYNVAYPYAIQWTTLTSGRTANGRTFGDAGFWQRKFLEYHQSGMAFADLDKLVGNTSTAFAEWQQHPTQDDYWAAAVPSNEDFARINMPMLTITGYYDGDQPGAMEYYQRHMQFGSEEAKAQHYLILGPWNHSGTRIPVQEFGGVKFGDAMMFDAFGLDKDWYNWTMRGGEKPEFIKDRVTYFVAGNNEWKSAPSLDAIANETMTLYLGSDHKTHTAYQTGNLLEELHDSETYSEYVYDPLDTTKAEMPQADNYLTDQTEVAMTDGDGLIFHSKPFDQPTEITGYLDLELYLELNVPDTDINATLYEVFADGTSIALSGETQRARYRESLTEEQLITPGEVNRFTFNKFYFFSRMVAKGSRLRLFIRPSNGLSQQRNYNSGKPVNQETRAGARTATIRLHHQPGEGMVSSLKLPVVK